MPATTSTAKPSILWREAVYHKALELKLELTRKDIEAISKITRYKNLNRKIAYYLREELKKETRESARLLNEFEKQGVNSSLLSNISLMGDAEKMIAELASRWSNELLVHASRLLREVRTYNKILRGLLASNNAVTLLAEASSGKLLAGEEILGLAEQILQGILEISIWSFMRARRIAGPIIASISKQGGESYTVELDVTRIKPIIKKITKRCLYLNFNCLPRSALISSEGVHLVDLNPDVLYLLKADPRLPSETLVITGVEVGKLVSSGGKARITVKGIIPENEEIRSSSVTDPLLARMILSQSVPVWGIRAGKKLVSALMKTPRFYLCPSGCIMTDNGFIVNRAYELNGERLLEVGEVPSYDGFTGIVQVDNSSRIMGKVIPPELLDDMKVTLSYIDYLHDINLILSFENTKTGDTVRFLPRKGKFIIVVDRSIFVGGRSVFSDFIETGKYARLSLDMIPIIKDGSIGSIYVERNTLHITVDNFNALIKTDNDTFKATPKENLSFGGVYGVVKMRNSIEGKLKLYLNNAFFLERLFEELIGGDLIVPLSDKCDGTSSSNVIACGSSINTISPSIYNKIIRVIKHDFLITNTSEFTIRVPKPGESITPVIRLVENNVILELVKDASLDVWPYIAYPRMIKEKLLATTFGYTDNTIQSLMKERNIKEITVIPFEFYPNTRKRTLKGKATFGLANNPYTGGKLIVVGLSIGDSTSLLYIVNPEDIIKSM